MSNNKARNNRIEKKVQLWAVLRKIACAWEIK